MPKLKKGETFVCVPCGRELIVSEGGISTATIWCCGKAMKRKQKARSKKASKKTTGRKTGKTKRR